MLTYPCFLLLILWLSSKVAIGDIKGDKSPYYQYLPDCSDTEKRKKDYPDVVKKHKDGKGILCPMIRDEEGFLSEWIAYYQVHGFSHIMIFDDGSNDDYREEIAPWIKTGFVSIEGNFSAESMNVSHIARRNDFKCAMALKALLEAKCKMKAVELGYDLFVSLDLDEYIVPYGKGMTAFDAVYDFFVETKRSQYCFEKLNFASAPHILEPVNLLTIEAYQSRMQTPSKMNYYTSVAPKCAYALQQLTNADFSNHTQEFIARCCTFHGCEGADFAEGQTFCREHKHDEHWRVVGKGKPWIAKGVINHYSRSLEKFTLKAKTWRTSTGEIQINQTAEQAAKGYDIGKFYARSVGWFHDDSALMFSCQVRDCLKEMTNQTVYIRPGKNWYRNLEFGKEVWDPDKRGRYGRAAPPGFKWNENNKYHYHGKKQGVLAPIS